MTSDSSNSNKVNYGKSAIINFHPMPKRFMVWDVLHREWVAPYGHEEKNAPYAYDMYELMCRLSLTKIGVKSGQYVICQSTNLFDKDGKEIFEGSIIETCRSYGYGFLPKGASGIVVFDHKELCYKIRNQGEFRLTANKMVKIIGHILSNPELMEEK